MRRAAQVRVLAGRLARNTWRHPVLVSLNWVATLAVALGLGAVYWQVTRETGGIQNRHAARHSPVLVINAPLLLACK